MAHRDEVCIISFVSLVVPLDIWAQDFNTLFSLLALQTRLAFFNRSG